MGIVLWGRLLAVNRDMEECLRALTRRWVSRGFKIDFMDRDDQQMVDFYERAAATAAGHHLM